MNPDLDPNWIHSLIQQHLGSLIRIQIKGSGSKNIYIWIHNTVQTKRDSVTRKVPLTLKICFQNLHLLLHCRW